MSGSVIKTFSITTTLQELGDGTSKVTDRVTHDSGSSHEIERFQGSSDKAKEIFDKLTEHWANAAKSAGAIAAI